MDRLEGRRIKVFRRSFGSTFEEDHMVETFMGLLSPSPSAPNGIVHIVARHGGNRFINVDHIIQVR